MIILYIEGNEKYKEYLLNLATASNATARTAENS